MSQGGGLVSFSPLKITVYTKGRDGMCIYAVEVILFDFMRSIGSMGQLLLCVNVPNFFLTVMTKQSVVDSD